MLLLLFGQLYATPLDMITPLDKRRRWLAVLTLIVFILIFIPAPLSQQLIAPTPVDTPRDSALLIAPLALIFSRLRF
jgi:hypothetical protein